MSENTVKLFSDEEIEASLKACKGALSYEALCAQAMLANKPDPSREKLVEAGRGALNALGICIANMGVNENKGTVLEAHTTLKSILRSEGAL